MGHSQQRSKTPDGRRHSWDKHQTVRGMIFDLLSPLHSNGTSSTTREYWWASLHSLVHLPRGGAQHCCLCLQRLLFLSHPDKENGKTLLNSQQCIGLCIFFN